MKSERMNEVIDRLFKRLSATYGADWTRQYEGVPISDVKTAWMHELAGYNDHLQAIAYALEILPERCLNVIQFRNLCRAAPAVDVPRIEAPKASPEVVSMVLAGLKPASNRVTMKDWAHRVIAKHDAGERVMPYTLMSARAALGMVG
jgi:hypothetical protein